MGQGQGWQTVIKTEKKKDEKKCINEDEAASYCISSDATATPPSPSHSRMMIWHDFKKRDR